MVVWRKKVAQKNEESLGDFKVFSTQTVIKNSALLSVIMSAPNEKFQEAEMVQATAVAVVSQQPGEMAYTTAPINQGIVLDNVNVRVDNGDDPSNVIAPPVLYAGTASPLVFTTIEQ